MTLEVYLRGDLANILRGLAAVAGKSYVAQGNTNPEYWRGMRDGYQTVALALGIPPKSIVGEVDSE